jgi:hypothetical protein
VPFFYESGEEVIVGDHVLIHGAAGQVELVADPSVAPDDWYVKEFGGGFMILCQEIVLGRIFVTPPFTGTDHVEFQSRGPAPQSGRVPHLVRGKVVLIQSRRLEDHGLSILAIKEWRAAESEAGRSSGLDDFFHAHGLCSDCRATGVVMTGWREPIGDSEVDSAAALGLDRLPVYEVCPMCGGSGKAPPNAPV